MCFSIGGLLTLGVLPFCRDEIGALVDDLVDNTKKLVRATSREIDKWRR